MTFSLGTIIAICLTIIAITAIEAYVKTRK